VKEDYTVRLEQVFQGPMDLLLYLVREQEVEIHEVVISRVIEGFLEYMQAMEDLDIELAGDFVVMAATLMAIKSRSLLPQDEINLEDELDPRDELIERLIEYRRFKEVSEGLGDRFRSRLSQFSRGRFSEAQDERTEPTLDLGELTSFDLLAAFSRLMRETLADRPHHIAGDPRPLRYYVREVAGHIRRNGNATLRGLLSCLEAPESKETLVGAFCALLELVRMGLIRAMQLDDQDDIRVEFVGESGEDELQSLLRSVRFDDEELDKALDAPRTDADEAPDETPDEEASEPEAPLPELPPGALLIEPPEPEAADEPPLMRSVDIPRPPPPAWSPADNQAFEGDDQEAGGAEPEN